MALWLLQSQERLFEHDNRLRFNAHLICTHRLFSKSHSVTTLSAHLPSGLGIAGLARGALSMSSGVKVDDLCDVDAADAATPSDAKGKSGVHFIVARSNGDLEAARCRLYSS